MIRPKWGREIPVFEWHSLLTICKQLTRFRVLKKWDDAALLDFNLLWYRYVQVVVNYTHSYGGCKFLTPLIIYVYFPPLADRFTCNIKTSLLSHNTLCLFKSSSDISKIQEKKKRKHQKRGLKIYKGSFTKWMIRWHRPKSSLYQERHVRGSMHAN